MGHGLRKSTHMSTFFLKIKNHSKLTYMHTIINDGYITDKIIDYQFSNLHLYD